MQRNHLNLLYIFILIFFFVISTKPLKIVNSEEITSCKDYLTNSKDTINASDLKIITEKYRSYIDKYIKESIKSFNNNSIPHGIANLYDAGVQLQILQNCIALNIPKIK
jgi:hypothetical protein